MTGRCQGVLECQNTALHEQTVCPHYCTSRECVLTTALHEQRVRPHYCAGRAESVSSLLRCTITECPHFCAARQCAEDKVRWRVLVTDYILTRHHFGMNHTLYDAVSSRDSSLRTSPLKRVECGCVPYRWAGVRLRSIPVGRSVASIHTGGRECGFNPYRWTGVWLQSIPVDGSVASIHTVGREYKCDSHTDTVALVCYCSYNKQSHRHCCTCVLLQRQQTVTPTLLHLCATAATTN